MKCVLELERLFGFRYFLPNFKNKTKYKEDWMWALVAVHDFCECDEFSSRFQHGIVVASADTGFGEDYMFACRYAHMRTWYLITVYICIYRYIHTYNIYMYIMCLFRYSDRPTFWSKHSPKGGFQVLRAFLSVVFLSTLRNWNCDIFWSF